MVENLAALHYQPKPPLGAYYRIDSRSLTDMHLALRDVGVIYASAVCHGGWNRGFGLPAGKRKGGRTWSNPNTRFSDPAGGVINLR